VHTGFWWGNQKESDRLEDSGIDGRVILKFIFKKRIGAWTGLTCLRIRRGEKIL
jgi:hypothetical protein